MLDSASLLNPNALGMAYALAFRIILRFDFANVPAVNPATVDAASRIVFVTDPFAIEVEKVVFGKRLVFL